MLPPQDLKIVFLGPGAIGGSLGAWVAQTHPSTYLLGRGATAAAVRENGLLLYQADRPRLLERVPVKMIDSLADLPGADVVVIAVKLYDLENAARMVKEQLDDQALVLGLQNGLEGWRILPRYFSRVIYGIVEYNAWVDSPGIIGYQEKGPLLIGTPDNSLQAELHALAQVFNPGVPTLITNRLADAAHTKLVVNLANAVTTLLRRPDPDNSTGLALYQDILSNTIYEGVRVVRAAGYREERQGGLPSWRLFWAAARLPHFLTRAAFRRNLNRLALSSMGQDVLRRKRGATELEYLNGYLLALAARTGLDTPYNRAINRLGQQHFARPDFEPLDPRIVWQAIHSPV